MLCETFLARFVAITFNMGTSAKIAKLTVYEYQNLNTI